MTLSVGILSSRVYIEGFRLHRLTDFLQLYDDVPKFVVLHIYLVA